jgi:hypothetical protein
MACEKREQSSDGVRAPVVAGWVSREFGRGPEKGAIRAQTAGSACQRSAQRSGKAFHQPAIDRNPLSHDRYQIWKQHWNQTGHGSARNLNCW